ncbi:TPA: tellurite resistance TerB family protein [Mannheimia haemolytica]|uniref:tellurite resistance TerB family protein n=1 Tax=Mannheimia haemolytica TaxID=75985 RepID=UPI00077EB4EF|nr:tellurite resistance TerB family protein [Mannheimia haemolytica]KYL05989.1 3-hydroxyisobutyrate dehydrogenase [Mannheimia haemolytica]UFK43216.1 tellurite resistance TerB family protein [Mannheimia haemolytica]HDL1111972.1 tellurite resistance TerB family protein [Mannheimia haemolytica]HDL1114413.1 tellurite resistance TerB family protein [Mannheimia haemolytica]HDL1122653.1 tellurite resistance TerB family protein [Mannheimia haemolytica]
MDFSKILSQVLDTAKDAATNGLIKGNSKNDQIAKIGGGAVAIGLISMLFGRNGGSSLAKLGSLAAIGSLAYQAYQKYQAQNSSVSELSQNNFENVDENVASKVILQAMIAAAASDGAITEEEKAAIVSQVGDEAEVIEWIRQEMDTPATVEEIARQVGNDQALATQVYLASRVVCRDLERKEIVFLANLADALGLAEALVEQLEKDAGF